MDQTLAPNRFAVPLDQYQFEIEASLLTPALIIYDEMIDANISTTLKHLQGQAVRWRPHVKTSKLQYTISKLVHRGIHQCKCSTTLEVTAACAAGMDDVLLAYPATHATATRMREIATSEPGSRLSCIVENIEQVESFRGSEIGVFVDLNSGMNRTGADPRDHSALFALVRQIDRLKLEFRGFHYYEGHFRGQDQRNEESLAHAGYDDLLSIVEMFERARYRIEEVITSGTPSFPYAVSYTKFREHGLLHRISAGTLVYNDCLSLGILSNWGYRPAALVLSSVVSSPLSHQVTCDAGHKVISADAGIPSCSVLGYPNLTPGKPSEEHLPVSIADTDSPTQTGFPKIGTKLYLLPRHVCPTVNNFDHALLVANGRVVSVEPVTARGHEKPLNRSA